MDPLDLLGAVLQRPRLDPLAADPPSPQQAGAAASSATHPGAAAYPTTAPHVATGAPRTDAGPPGGAVMSLVLRLAADLLDRDQPGLLEGALETLDRAPVRRIVTRQHRRALHLVNGRERMDYTVLGQRDCSCQAFAQDQARSVHPRCKHVLAVRLAGSLGRLEEQEVADETFETYAQLG